MNIRDYDFDLGSLKHFYLVAYFQGFSRAARSSGLSQPALSTGVKKLEKSLGVRLFNRSSTRFGLTSQGAALLEFCQQMESKWSELQAGISNINSRSIRRLRVGSALSIGFSPVADLVRRLVSQRQSISVEVSTADSYQIVRELQGGTLDLAFLPDDVQGHDLKYKSVSSDSVVLVARSKLKLSGKGSSWLTLLADQILVTYPQETPMRSLVDRILIRENIRFHSEISVTGVEGIKAIVQRGVGMAFVLRSLVEAELRSGSLTSIELPISLPKRGITIAFRRNDERIAQVLKELD